jgi:uncharacterized coiled-coil DUF342 family protein
VASSRRETDATNDTSPVNHVIRRAGTEQLDGLAREIRELREQLATLVSEAKTQAQLARAEAQEERAATKREAEELRQQARVAQEQSLRSLLAELEKASKAAQHRLHSVTPPDLAPLTLKAVELGNTFQSISRQTEELIQRIGEVGGLVATVTRELRELLPMVRGLQETRGSLSRMAGEVNGISAHVQNLREKTSREQGVLLEESRMTYLEFLRTALEGLEDMRAEIANTTTRLKRVSGLAHEVGERVVDDLEGQIGNVRHDLAEAREAIQELPRKAEESRRQVEEVLQRLAEFKLPAPETKATHVLETITSETPTSPTERDSDVRYSRLGATVEMGLVVASVLPDSSAVTAGLAVGDVIEEINGIPVIHGPEIREAIQKHADVAELLLRYTRGQSSQEVNVRLGVINSDDPELPKDRNGLGLTVESRVIVTEIEPGSPAEHAGLTVGDVIVQIDDATISEVADLEVAIEDLPIGAETTFQVIRDQEPRTLHAQLDKTTLADQG